MLVSFLFREEADKTKSKTYEEFVEKFKPKKTTDDCMTPPLVYDAVKDWACAEYGIDPESIVRPFWPGGDYEHRIREFGLYRWDETKTVDTPIKDNDHAMDDTRYFVMTFLRYKAGKQRYIPLSDRRLYDA